VIWKSVYLFQPDEEDIAAGTAVLACPQGVLNYEPWQSLIRARPAGLPSWVCLACTPGWLEVHQFTLRDYRRQIEKEEAVLAGDFERAAGVLRLQESTREQTVALVAILLGFTEAELRALTHSC
jgi:hypothetical protein